MSLSTKCSRWVHASQRTCRLLNWACRVGIQSLSSGGNSREMESVLELDD